MRLLQIGQLSIVIQVDIEVIVGLRRYSSHLVFNFADKKGMRYIYTWHEDTQMYSIRVATEEEESRISEALKLFKQCKNLHDSIINDADSLYNGDIERFIDDEAYFVVQNLHKDLDTVNKLTEGLMTLAIGNYYFYLW